MNESKKISAVFVTTENSLRAGGGGVQICTADYLSLLRAGGFELQVVAFEPDQRLLTRALRKMEGRPFLRMLPPALTDEIAVAVERTGARIVFFNLLDYPEVVQTLRERFGNTLKLIHLSHGLESTDLCIAQQVRRHEIGTLRYDGADSRQLGAKLHCEADYRRYLDGVLCLSPLDAELERWLGTARTEWFSRPVREPALNFHPVEGRVGCVATLDHAPNFHGLLALFGELEQLKTDSFRFRLAGSPAEHGRKMADRFKFVEYLGRLSDDELRREAESWCCFVHPVFHYARGCSTKLAVGLGWGLPIATTVSGARGYVWDEMVLRLATGPKDLAALVFAGAKANDFAQRREQSLRIAALQPAADQLAEQMRRFILSVGSASLRH